jgi:hypothetical protein
LSKWQAYEMRKSGEWERTGIRIIRLGANYRVIVQSILALLGEDTCEVADEQELAGLGQAQASAKITSLESSSCVAPGGKP